MRRRSIGHIALAGLAVLATVVAGCEDGGNMNDTPRYEPLEQSALAGRSTSARQPPAGAVSRDDWVADPVYHTGAVSGGRFVETLPLDVDEQVLSRGHERFEIFCSPCHGLDGAGDGIVPQRGYTPPPSFHIDRLRAAPDGYFFTVITEGFGRMPSYASQVPTSDRWAIIAYVRALQLSQHAPVEWLTQADRNRADAGTRGGRP